VELGCSQRKKREKLFGGVENVITKETTAKNKIKPQQQRRRKTLL